MPYKIKFYIHVLIASLVFIAMCAAAWYIFSIITDASVRVGGIKRDLAILELKRNQINEITKKYEVAKGEIAKLDDVFLDRKDRLSFIRLVEDFAALYGVSEVIEASDETPAKGVQTVSFNINIAGSFSSVLQFIDALEQSRYFTTIETVQIMRAAASPALPQGGVKAQFAAKVYAR